MELRDYLKIMVQRIWLLVGIVLVVVLGVVLFTRSQPASWDGSLLINITKKAETSQNSSYQYDKYYSIQASGLFADTVVSWLSDPDSVLEVYNKVSVKVPDASITQLGKIFNAKKVLPSNVQMKYSSTDRDTIEPILIAGAELVKVKTQNLLKLDSTNNFEITYGDPVVIEHSKSLVTNIVVAFVVGIILGLMIVFSVEYLKPRKK